MKMRKVKKNMDAGERGFSLVELLISMGITVVILTAAAGVLHSLSSANTSASLLTEVEQNLDAGLYLMKRDFINAGTSAIPRDGIAPATAAPWPNRPGIVDGRFDNTADIPNRFGNICAINPGLRADGTEMVNILLRRELQGGKRMTEIRVVTNTSNSVDIDLVDLEAKTEEDDIPGTGFNNLIEAGVRVGDLVFISGQSVLRYVTAVTNERLTFTAAADPSGFNATGLNLPPPGGVSSGQTITLLKLVTYWVEDFRLMRQINYYDPNPVATGVNRLALSYAITNMPTNTGTGCTTDGGLDGGNLTTNRMLGEIATSVDRKIDIRQVGIDFSCGPEDRTLPKNRVINHARRSQVYVANLNICNPYKVD